MITPDTTETFPACATFGFTAEPMILAKIVQREGGFERVQRIWDQARRRYNGAPFGPRPQADIEAVLIFWHAIGGVSGSFRFKDWSDYKSCRLDETPAATDQPLVLVPGSPGGYKMIKEYTHGLLTHQRRINRPIGSTVRVANQVGAEQPNTAWTVEESTGLITPGGTFSGTPTFWGGEFDVWCRFDSELPVELSNHLIQSLNVSIIEKRENADG